MTMKLNGFPTADEIAQKSIIGGLRDLLERMELASNYGYTSVTTTNEEEIAIIHHNSQIFEMMGYELSYEYNHKEIEWVREDILAEEIIEVKLSWYHKIHKHF